ncbi:MAG TPA: type II secretion system F family protein [Phycisphaerales bacterium]|nr:type II secretion system F family protein [Phycisphaerales bacterium]
MQGAQLIILPALVFLAVLFLGGAIIAARGAKRKAIAPRLFTDQISDVAGEGEQRAVELVDRVGRAVTFGKTTDKLQKQLTQAGLSDPSAPQVFLGSKILLLVIGAAMVGVATIWLPVPPLLRIVLMVFVGAVMSFVPNLYVSMRRSKRSQEVRRSLADATDLLEVCVCAGMGLDMAWNVVTDEIRHVSSVLADEMALTNLEIQLNAPRHVAMRHMAERTNSPELLSLVAVLIQSERFGTSVGEALQTFAASLRQERSAKAEESAEKMSVKLIIPMVLFVFPAAMVVMVGPAVLKLLDLFEH